MQTKKLATIFMVVALSVLLVTFVIIQGADAGRRSGAGVGTPNASPTNNTGGLKTNAGPKDTNTSSGSQDGFMNPGFGGGSGNRAPSKLHQKLIQHVPIQDLSN